MEGFEEDEQGEKERENRLEAQKMVTNFERGSGHELHPLIQEGISGDGRGGLPDLLGRYDTAMVARLCSCCTTFGESMEIQYSRNKINAASVNIYRSLCKAVYKHNISGYI
jgi:hypothetical protein